MTYFQDHNFTFWFVVLVIGVLVLGAAGIAGTRTDVTATEVVIRGNSFAVISDVFSSYGSLLAAVDVADAVEAAQNLQQQAQYCATRTSVPQCSKIAQESGYLATWLSSLEGELDPGSKELASYVAQRRSIGDLVNQAASGSPGS